MKRHEKGQSLIEYTILLGIMLVTALGVVLALKKAIIARTYDIATRVAGPNGHNQENFDYGKVLKDYSDQTWSSEKE